MLRVNRLALVQSSCALSCSIEAELFGIDCYTFVEHLSIDFFRFNHYRSVCLHRLSRALLCHFKDADNYLCYRETLSGGNSSNFCSK